MNTYPSISAGQSTEATRSAMKWSLSERVMFNPDCIFCHSDGCKKVKKAHHWIKEPLSKFEFGGGETVIKTAEAKNKIRISFYGSRIWPLCLCEAQFHPSYDQGQVRSIKHGEFRQSWIMSTRHLVRRPFCAWRESWWDQLTFRSWETATAGSDIEDFGSDIYKSRSFEIHRHLPITQFILYWNRLSVWLHQII